MLPMVRVVLCFGLVLLGTQRVFAQCKPVEIPAGASDPVAVQVDATSDAGKGVALPLAGPELNCALLAESGKLTLKPQCMFAWLLGGKLEVDPKTDKVRVVRELSSPANGYKGACIAGSDLKLQVAVSDVPTEALPVLRGKDDALSVCSTLEAFQRQPDGTLKPFRLEKGKPLDNAELLTLSKGTLKVAKKKEVKRCDGQLEERRKYLEPPDWCPDDQYPGHQVVCVKLYDEARKVVRVPYRSVARPDRGLVVHVLTEPGMEVTVTWGGTRKLTRPGVTPPKKAQAGEEAAERAAEEQDVVQLVPSSITFSPRAPGQADVTVEVKPSTPAVAAAAPAAGAGAAAPAANAKGKLSVELEVDELSWGAVRFGFATVFGEAATARYEIRSAAGAEQAEIALADDPAMNIEAVLGFAPYIFDLWAYGGRSETGGPSAYLAPYIGFGVLGQGAAGVEAFGSLHVGLELGITSSFSIAGTAVWRKITELQDGYRVGSPVDAGTTFTTDGTGFGFGLILNVSPDFLKFATPSSTGNSDSKAPSSNDGDSGNEEGT